MVMNCDITTKSAQLNLSLILSNAMFIQRQNSTFISLIYIIIISLLILKLQYKQKSLNQSYEFLIEKNSIAGKNRAQIKRGS